MQFSRDGEWYQAIRITGPTHNLLALRLNEIAPEELIIERLPEGAEASLIDTDDVQKQVLEGVAEANVKLGTKYDVEGLRFVTTDTPSPVVYRYLAKEIVERLVQGEPFTAA